MSLSEVVNKLLQDSGRVFEVFESSVKCVCFRVKQKFSVLDELGTDYEALQTLLIFPSTDFTPVLKFSLICLPCPPHSDLTPEKK